MSLPKQKKLTLKERVQCLPCRTQTFLLATATFISVGFIVVLLSAIFVNQMKNQLITVAEMEIHDLHNRAILEIQKLVEAQEANGVQVNSLADVANDPEIRAQFRILSNQRDVVMTALISNDGTCIYQYGQEEQLHNCPKKTRPGNELKGLLPESNPGERLTFDFQVVGFPENVKAERVAVESGDRLLGYVEYGIEPSAALQKLEPISKNISRSLSWMVGLVLSFFGIALFALHRVGNHHLELQSQHAESKKLATIGTMASGLAHEIRNPLHAMNLHLEAAKEEIDDPREDSTSKVRDTIHSVQRQITSLNGIVSNFMNFANPGRMEFEPNNLATLVNEVTNLLRPELDEKEIELSVDIDREIEIEADPTAARQVITNIILNAAQAMEFSDLRDLMIRASVKDGMVKICFQDTGTGIPKGKENEMFDLFYSTKKGGSGFGLAIAKRIMESHKGSIHAENAEQQGARILVSFPVSKDKKAKQVDRQLLESDYEEGYIG